MQETVAPPRAEAIRLYFVQWLRVFLICLVVAHHAGRPYGPTGGAWPVSDPASSDLLLPFFALNAAFFMGFFFLIAGYFVEGSYDRKGSWPFLRSRLIRLGIPLLVFAGPLFGTIAYTSSGTTRGYLSFMWFEYLLPLRLEFGPLWFIAHLLLYAFVTRPGGRVSHPRPIRFARSPRRATRKSWHSR
jgi:fucose 4-O-acetylase-like acetyltransferase